MVVLAWNDIKQSGDLIKSSDWNDFVSAHSSHVNDFNNPHNVTAGQLNALTKTSSTLTIYVDNVNGNDDTGDGSETNPYKTVGKVVSVLPDSFTEQITIHLKASSTIYDNLKIANKIFTDSNGSLIVEGEMTQLTSGTVTAWNNRVEDPEYQGIGAYVSQLTDSNKSWTANQFKYKLLHIYDNNGYDYYAIIDSNDATNIYFAHRTTTDVTNKSYEILDWGTQISSLMFSNLSGSILVQFLWVNGQSKNGVTVGSCDNLTIQQCRVDKNVNGGMAIYFKSSSIGVKECYLEGHKTNYDGIFAAYGMPVRWFVAGTKIHNFRIGLNVSGVEGYGFFRGGGRIISDSDNSVAAEGVLFNGPANGSFYSPYGNNVIDGHNPGICGWGLSKIQYDVYNSYASSVTTHLDIYSALNYAGDYEIKGNFRIRPTPSAPTSTPSNGGVLYVSNGALYYRGSNGTVTKLGDA